VKKANPGIVLKHKQCPGIITSRMKLYGFQCHFHEVGGHSPPYGALKTTWRNLGWAAPTMIATGQLALPMNRRTNFLRKRLPGGGSCL